MLKRLASTGNVFGAGARETAHDYIANFLRDGFDGLEIAFTRDRKTRFDHIDAKPRQLPRNRDFFLLVHAATRRLLTVAQRRVEDANQFTTHDGPSSFTSVGPCDVSLASPSGVISSRLLPVR